MRPITVNQLSVISLLAGLLCCGAGVAAPAWHVAPRAAWVQDAPQPAGVLLHDRQIRISAAGDERYEHLIVRLSAAQTGEHAAQLSTSVDPRYQQLVIHSLRLKHRGDNIKALTAAQIGALLQPGCRARPAAARIESAPAAQRCLAGGAARRSARLRLHGAVARHPVPRTVCRALRSAVVE